MVAVQGLDMASDTSTLSAATEAKLLPWNFEKKSSGISEMSLHNVKILR